jgi:hypothetical protein
MGKFADSGMATVWLHNMGMSLLPTLLRIIFTSLPEETRFLNKETVEKRHCSLPECRLCKSEPPSSTERSKLRVGVSENIEMMI